MGVRENKVERYLDAEIKKIGGITRKWVSPGMDGVPDRIVVIGDVFFCEVKTSDGRHSFSQIREHERLRKYGAVVCTVWGETGVNQLLEDLRIHSWPQRRDYV